MDTGDFEDSKWVARPPMQNPTIPASLGGEGAYVPSSPKSPYAPSGGPLPPPAGPPPSGPPPGGPLPPPAGPPPGGEGLPDGWRAVNEAGGGVYYYHISNPTGTTTRNRPNFPSQAAPPPATPAPAPGPPPLPAPAPPAAGELPDGWRAVKEPGGGEYYYHISNPSGTTTRQRPQAQGAPPVNYAKSSSSLPSASSASLPPDVSKAGLPDGWRAVKEADGGEYFYHISNPAATTTRQRPDSGAGVGA